MSIYNEYYEGEHKLSVEEAETLKDHLRQCEAPFLNCDECLKLYIDLGYSEYRAFREEVEKQYGPTESEQHI